MVVRFGINSVFVVATGGKTPLLLRRSAGATHRKAAQMMAVSSSFRPAVVFLVYAAPVQVGLVREGLCLKQSSNSGRCNSPLVLLG